MSQEQPIFDYHEETQAEKLARKSKESPFMVIAHVANLLHRALDNVTQENWVKCVRHVEDLQNRELQKALIGDNAPLRIRQKTLLNITPMGIDTIFCIGSLAAAVGYGAYSYKNRGAMSTSVFLMQFRVISQGAAVGALTAGMLYTLYNNHFNKPKPTLS